MSWIMLSGVSVAPPGATIVQGFHIEKDGRLIEPTRRRVYNSFRQGDEQVPNRGNYPMNSVDHFQIHAESSLTVPDFNCLVHPFEWSYKNYAFTRITTGFRSTLYINVVLHDNEATIRAIQYTPLGKGLEQIWRQWFTHWTGKHKLGEVVDFIKSRSGPNFGVPCSTYDKEQRVEPGFKPPEIESFKDTMKKAVAQANPILSDKLGSRLLKTSNALEYSVEAVTMVKNLITGRFLKELPDLSQGLYKGLANAYLRYQYGERLFIADSKVFLDVLNGTKRQLTRKGKVGATTNIGLVQIRKTLFFDPNSAILPFLQGIDATLSPKNLWDLIPYSFVADWFFPIEQKLDIVPGLADELLIISNCTTSSSMTISTDSDGRPYILKGFSRSVGGGGSLSQSYEMTVPNWRQSLSGTSLILQRMK